MPCAEAHPAGCQVRIVTKKTGIETIGYINRDTGGGMGRGVPGEAAPWNAAEEGMWGEQKIKTGASKVRIVDSIMTRPRQKQVGRLMGQRGQRGRISARDWLIAEGEEH